MYIKPIVNVSITTIATIETQAFKIGFINFAKTYITNINTMAPNNSLMAISFLRIFYNSTLYKSIKTFIPINFYKITILLQQYP